MEHTSPIRFLCLTFLLLQLVFMSGCTGSNQAPPTAQQSPHRTLALVSLTSSAVSVKNLDAAKLTDVILLINVRQPGAKTVQSVVGDIPPGKTVTVNYADFTDIDGKRFDASTTNIYTVAIKTPLETNDDGYKLFLCSSNICQPSGR
jgi:hypothetical protein